MLEFPRGVEYVMEGEMKTRREQGRGGVVCFKSEVLQRSLPGPQGQLGLCVNKGKCKRCVALFSEKYGSFKQLLQPQDAFSSLGVYSLETKQKQME